MRVLACALTVILLLLQHQMWLAEDGWRAVRSLTRQVAAAHADNDALTARNLRLAAALREAAPATVQPAAAVSAALPPRDTAAPVVPLAAPVATPP